MNPLEGLERYRKRWDNFTKGWKGIVIYIILGIFFALLINGILSLIFSTQFPVVTVSSESMVPTLNKGDLVFVVAAENYEPGDIIVFNGWEPEPIIHRIVAKVMKTDSGYKVYRYDDFNQLDDNFLMTHYREYFSDRIIYITKGDNNPVCDQCIGVPPVQQREVYGKAALVIPLLGWVKILFVEYFIRKPLMGVIFLFFSAIIYGVYKRYV